MPDIKHFVRKHISETLTVAAFVLGGLSAWRELFYGGIGLTLFFLVVCAALAIFFPVQVDSVLKKFYELTHKKDKTSEIIVGSCTAVVAFLLPFIFFGMVGLLAGSSYHYFTGHAQGSHSKDKAA
ncbi:MAG TPA: hypothetical protein VLE89_08160 [Chlamydiales bacterium]|nr:hypothetical protein [Chlamydiales bacterium]